jgi:hypothetical protein
MRNLHSSQSECEDGSGDDRQARETDFPRRFTGSSSQIRSVVYSIDSCPHRVQHARSVLEEVQAAVGHMLEQIARDTLLYVVQDGLQNIQACSGHDKT